MRRVNIFISHRRNNGVATTDAILIKNILSKETSGNVFMDVAEDYLGQFPQTLKNEIRKSDIFLLVIPKSENYDYLSDPENWVHKEIKYALTYRDAVNKPSRIIPVVFDRDFKFPDKESLGDIAEITDYSFIYYDTNNTDSANKLIRAAGLKRKVGNTALMAGIAIAVIVAAVLAYLLMPRHAPNPASEYDYAESRNFVEAVERFDTFNMFTDSCDRYLQAYLTWYLSELNDGNSDPALNAEFNQVYVKEYAIRLSLMAYLAYTSLSLERPNRKSLTDELINKCYDNIPEEARYPISLRSYSMEERNAIFDTILDKTIETLNTDPRLRQIDDARLPVVKQTLKSKMWPY